MRWKGLIVKACKLMGVQLRRGFEAGNEAAFDVGMNRGGVLGAAG